MTKKIKGGEAMGTKAILLDKRILSLLRFSNDKKNTFLVVNKSRAVLTDGLVLFDVSLPKQELLVEYPKDAIGDWSYYDSLEYLRIEYDTLKKFEKALKSLDKTNIPIIADYFVLLDCGEEVVLVATDVSNTIRIKQKKEISKIQMDKFLAEQYELNDNRTCRVLLSLDLLKKFCDALKSAKFEDAYPTVFLWFNPNDSEKPIYFEHVSYDNGNVMVRGLIMPVTKK